MTFARPGMLLAGVVLATVAVSARQEGRGATYRAVSDLVLVDVAVRSGNSPVSGLAATNFELFDNGVRQQIGLVAVEAIPIDLTLVLDVSGSTSAVIEQFKVDADKISGALRPDDRVRLVVFSNDVMQVLPFQTRSHRLPVDDLRSLDGTSLYDAVFLSLLQPRSSGRRHLIIVFTDGVDTTSLLDAATIMDLAGRADGVLHLVLSPAGGPTGGERPSGLRSLWLAAERTGGTVQSLDARGKVLDTFTKVFEEFRRGYLLHYQPTGVSNAGWHQLDVRVPGSRRFEVRARKGYFGG